MNRPPGVDGAVFTEAEDGDQRNDLTARSALSSWLGIQREWATLRQVHGTTLIRALRPGELGEGDALWSDVPGLPLAVFTADCFGVVLKAKSAVGVAHAGWRGATLGVVSALRAEMTAAGHPPSSAAIGPGIGPCCFEVGRDVAERFPDHLSETSWGAVSVDLAASIRRELEGLDVWTLGVCTMHEGSHYSYRRTKSAQRVATIAWVA
jgi:YfiH family protein